MILVLFLHLDCVWLSCRGWLSFECLFNIFCLSSTIRPTLNQGSSYFCLVQTVCKVQCQLLMFIISNPMWTFAIEALIEETTFLNKKGGFIETILTQRVYYHHRPPPLCQCHLSGKIDRWDFVLQLSREVFCDGKVSTEGILLPLTPLCARARLIIRWFC